LLKTQTLTRHGRIRIMEIAPTSYLRVNGASIVDGSDTAVRL
jgi:hypothetical protein